MAFFSRLFAVALLANAVVLGAPLGALKNCHAASLPLSSRTIFQLDQEQTWFENVISTRKGDLLITQLEPSPALYLLREPQSPTPKATIIHTFPNMTGLLGIAETETNTFVVVGGSFIGTGVPDAGTFSAWEVILDHTGHTETAVRKITDIPEAVFLNGVEPVPGSDSVVLISDSTLGVVYRLDTLSNTYEVVLQGEELEYLPNEPINVGINGIKIRGGYLYFDNSFEATIYRIRLTQDGYPVSGANIESVAVVEGAPFLDDFVFSQDGTIWATSNLGNTVYAIKPDGGSEIVVGSSTELTVAGDTAAVFGNTKDDASILYVVTGGAIANPVNGTITEPAKVVAVDTSYYH